MTVSIEGEIHKKTHLRVVFSKLRIIQLSIVAGIVTVLVWASLATLDIAVSARGEIASTSDMEKIQHREGGMLDELFVKEGAYVHQGQPIARLRALERDSQLNTMRIELTELRLEIERFAALIARTQPNFAQHSDNDELIAFHTRLWREEKRKNDDAEALLLHDIAHKQQLMASMRARKQSSQEQLAIIQEQKRIKDQLHREDILPYMTVLDMRIQEKNMLREIQNLDEALLNESFGLQKITKQLDEMRSTKRSEYMEKRAKARKELTIKTEQLPNVSDQVERLVVTSPIDGFVNEIHYNYHSAVISPGESIADISPLRSNLIAEAKIPRKDIGFIETGQSVRVKLDSFPFTKYGAIDGEVTAISKHSYEEKEEIFYKAKIALSRDYLEYSGTIHHIGPDMEFVADIKTGSRRVIDYALKPIMIALEQSFTER